MRKPPSSPFFYEPGRHEFLIVVNALNAKDEFGEELRNLVTRWKASGANLMEMLKGDPDLMNSLTAAYQGGWAPTFGMRAISQALPQRDMNETPVQAALRNFATLTMIRDCDLLGGPCENCDRYFIQKKRGLRRYCSRKCSSRATAIKFTTKRREGDHERRIGWAREARTRWSSKRRAAETWESFVLRYIDAHEKDWFQRNNRTQPRSVSEKSLTRWVNEGQLQKPKEVRKGK
jgi:hypothetical protein